LLVFRHCDPRFPFLWQRAEQPPARWHGAGEGPANYFADTPSGAWAEFLRHEGITDTADLAGVNRALWAVELPDAPLGTAATPDLPEATLFGDEDSYPACQAAARTLRTAGTTRLVVRGAALLPGQARGWHADTPLRRATPARDGHVFVHFGPCDFEAWPVARAGSPPAEVLPLVRHFGHHRHVTQLHAP
jgi:hypothetical protein